MSPAFTRRPSGGGCASSATRRREASERNRPPERAGDPRAERRAGGRGRDAKRVDSDSSLRACAVDLTESVLSEIRDSGGVVFGFGNIGGVGEELVEHWAGIGEVVGDGV